MTKPETGSTSEIFEFETTPQDREKMRSEGVVEDEIPPVGVRRYARSRFAVKPREAKAKISLYVDCDILEYFRARAESSDAAPYQTQINNELRRVMEADTNGKGKLDSSILDDTEFLRALKEKLETV